MNQSYKLTFLTDEDLRVTITIPRAKSVPVADLKTAMDNMISANIISTSAGLLKSREAAELVSVTSTVVPA